VNDALARRVYSLRARIDLVRRVGPSHAWRRRGADRRLERALVDRGPRVAEAMWREAAAKLGAEVREVAPTVLEFRLNGSVTRVRGQATPLADWVSRQIANDKPLAHRLLADAGLPVPVQEVVPVREHRRAREFLDRVGVPCVVKPVAGGGGAGVTAEVRTPEQLRRALVRAGKFNSRALIERQAEGDSYRLLVLDGEVLDVLRRTRPRVVGDGRSTIEELIFREYARRIEDEGPSGLKLFAADLDCLFTLERAGVRLDTVLPEGQTVVIKTVTNYNGPDETERLRGDPPVTLAQPAREAAAALGVRLAGVDIVAPDLDRPLHESGGVVLEVNPVPGLTHHYNVADAKPIAVSILRALLTA
jgi:cyanophycin synthetase